MKNNMLQIHQANLRRWLDKRVPLHGGDLTLTESDRATLYQMMRKWNIPLIIRREFDNTYSLVVNEGKGSHYEWYVLAIDIKRDDVMHVVTEGFNLGSVPHIILG